MGGLGPAAGLGYGIWDRGTYGAGDFFFGTGFECGERLRMRT